MTGGRRRGPVALAMIEAAWPPATVGEICGRAQWQGERGVARRLGQVTASRLVAAGELVVLDGHAPPARHRGRRGRPARVVAARERLQQQQQHQAGADAGAASAVQALYLAFGVRALGAGTV